MKQIFLKQIFVIFTLISIFVAFVAFYIISCNCRTKKQAKFEPLPINISAIITQVKDIPLTIEGIGHVQALRSVDVRSQITGTLKKTCFIEGNLVKEGDQLVVVDPSSFQVKLREAQSTLRRDNATVQQSKRDYIRYKKLLDHDVISHDDLEQKHLVFKRAIEQSNLSRAQVANAQLNLDYCFINSPINGVAGLQKIKTGNLVIANKDIIVTINQIQPILVIFFIPERELFDIQRYAALAPLVAKAKLSNSVYPSEQGKLIVIDNKVDIKTGQVAIQAEFPNVDCHFWPGQFVEASIVLTIDRGRIVLPSRAIITTQQGQAIFIITAEGAVQLRPIKVAYRYGDESVIGEGLAVGEIVATSNIVRLFPGAKVTVNNSKNL